MEFSEQQSPHENLHGWESLLAATARLLDAHDSCHEPGNAPVVIQKEERRGKHEGLWLSIAIDLLRYMAEVEAHTNESWIPLDDFIASAMEQYGVSESDVIWVAQFLSVPTRLSLRRFTKSGEQKRYSIKKTALIERAGLRQTRRAALTQEGRAAVRLASAASGILYAQYDAQKMVAALRFGDYREAANLLGAMIQELRIFSQDLNRLLERPVNDQTRKFWLDHKDAYFEALGAFDQCSIEAMALLGQDDQLRRYEEYESRQENETPPLEYLQEQLRRLAAAVIRLNSVLQRAINELLNQTGQNVGTVDFQKMAMRLAFSPLPNDQMEAVSNLLWPDFPESGAVCATDLLGIVPPRKSAAKEKALRFEPEGAEKNGALSALQAFLDKQGKVLRGRLLKGEEIPLGDLLKQHLRNDEDFMEKLAAITGVYLYPKWLDDTEAVEVAARRNAEIKLPDGSILRGEEPVLRRAKKENRDGRE